MPNLALLKGIVADLAEILFSRLVDHSRSRYRSQLMHASVFQAAYDQASPLRDNRRCSGQAEFPGF